MFSFLKETIRDVIVTLIILFGFVFIAILLTGCSASWHFKKAVSKDPSILQRDTITVRDTVEIYIPQIQVEDSIVVIHDTLRVDSIISVNTPLSADRVRELRKKIYEQVQKDLERDTVKLDTINYNIMAYYKNGGLFIEMQRSDSTISKPVEVDVVVDKISEPKSKLDNIWEKIKLFSVWVLILLIVVHVLRRVADKTLS